MWVWQSTEKRYLVINAVGQNSKINATKWWSSDTRLHCPRQQKETIGPIYEIMAAAVTVALYTNQIFE